MGILQCRNINILVGVIVIFFGISSWIDINGLWVQLPLLVPHLPESWTLPSYFIIIIQIGNIGPLLFTIVTHCFPKKRFEGIVSFSIIFIGAVSCLLLIFFWKETSFVAGEEHSVALLVLVFFLSLVDCTSSVAFLTYMSAYKLKYMTAYFVGEGLSGMLPSLVALGQGVGQMSCVEDTFLNETTNETTLSIYPVYHEARFPVEHFFAFLLGMLVLSGISFLLLNFSPYCKKERSRSGGKGERDVSLEIIGKDNSSSNKTNDFNEVHIIEDINNIKPGKRSNVYYINDPDNEDKSLSPLCYAYFLIITAWINGITNSALLSVQTYSTLPYSSQAYHLSATLANIANPLGCFVTMFYCITSPAILGLLTFIGSATGAYIMTTAVLSPDPPLRHDEAGPAIIVTAWVITYFLLTYTKVAIATRFRVEGRKALLWCGAFTQIGSLIASIVMYVLVNINKLFKESIPCT